MRRNIVVSSTDLYCYIVYVTSKLSHTGRGTKFATKR